MTGPPPLRLFLVRHGITDGNEARRLMGRSEIALNQRGRAQAEALATALRGAKPGAVLSSPRRRTQETAAAIAAACGLAVETEPGLDEVWLGRWQGKTYDEIAGDPDLVKYLEDPTYECDAVEPASEIRERVAAVAERLRASSPERDVVLVSHGDPLRILVAHLLSMELRSFRRLTILPGSASVVQLGRREVRLVALNWRPSGDGLVGVLSNL